MIQVAVVIFLDWKYNLTALLFLSAILWLCLCVACILLAEPICLFAWRCWVTWRYNIKSQERGGGAKCACPTLWGAALESSGHEQPGRHFDETATVHTREKLKLKYRSHYTGIFNINTNVGIDIIDIWIDLPTSIHWTVKVVWCADVVAAAAIIIISSSSINKQYSIICSYFDIILISFYKA